MDFIISAVLAFWRLPVTLASKLELRNYPFDCKTHRGLLLTRLLFFHTQTAFLCKMCLGQTSNTNWSPMVLYPLLLPMKENSLICNTRQDSEISRPIFANLVETCLSANDICLRISWDYFTMPEKHYISYVINAFYLFPQAETFRCTRPQVLSFI